MGQWMFGWIISALAGVVTGAINTLWRLLAATVLTTPDVTALPQVQVITARSVAIVDIAYVLAIIAAGVMVMARESVQARYGLNDLAPRLVLGFIAANFSVSVCREAITLANALTRALTGDTITAHGSFTQLLRIITAALTDNGTAFLSVVIVLVLAVLVASLLILWITRLITLIILAGVAPLALACHGLPWTEPVARLWWRSLAGCLTTVIAQALALHTGLSILLDPDANQPALGFPHDPSATFNLLIAVCLLWMTVRIPGLIRRHLVGTTRQRSALGSILRFVVLQYLTRSLVGRVRGLAAGTRRPPVRPPGAAGPGGRGGPVRPHGPRPLPGGAGRAGRPGTTGPGARTSGRGSSTPSSAPRTGTGWPEPSRTPGPVVPSSVRSSTGRPAHTPSALVPRTGQGTGTDRPTGFPVTPAGNRSARTGGAVRAPRSSAPVGPGAPARTVTLPAGRSSSASPAGTGPWPAPTISRVPTGPRASDPRVTPPGGPVRGRGVRRGR